MEMHNGLPMFSCLKDIQPVKTITKLMQCSNLKHKSFSCEFAVYEDGTQAQITFCPECEEEKLQKEQKQLEKQQKEENIKHCRECNIEPEYYNKTLEDYKPQTESQEKTLGFVKSMLNHDLKKLVLLGSNGTGKTMIGSILAKEMNGKIYTMYEISTMIRQSYTVKAVKTELEIVNELASIPFLAIDEVGRTNGSSSEKNWLSYILDKRHVRKLPFMLMSNTHLLNNCPKGGCDNCFENFMDSDIISRLYQDSKIINIVAPDFRENN